MRTDFFASPGQIISVMNNQELIIKIAVTEKELEDIYRFRFRVYVEEMFINVNFADHALKRVVDPADSGAFNAGAWLDGELISCVRLNRGGMPGFDDYRNLYKMDSIENFSPYRSVITSKLMVAEKHRNSRINILMQQFAYKVALEHDIEYCFIECKEELVHYYHKFGFRSYTEPIPHYVYSTITPLVLNLLDIEYLEKTRSPFMALYNEFYLKNEAGILKVA